MKTSKMARNSKNTIDPWIIVGVWIVFVLVQSYIFKDHIESVFSNASDGLKVVMVLSFLVALWAVPVAILKLLEVYFSRPW